MGTITTIPITCVDKLSKREFIEKFYKPQKPVLIRKLTQNWPAHTKWNLEYIQSKAGNQVVPLYDNTETKGRQLSAIPACRMKLYDYIEILKSRPTELRIFFYNLLQKMPDLLKDINYPEKELGVKFFKKLPTLFFGGKGSKVLVHYDLDMSHLFHVHFQGTKRVVLFAPDQEKYLYKMPFTVHNIERIDLDNPDFEKYPALRYLKGIEVTMQHGDLLYMPSGYWHYIKYLNGGFSLTLRSFPKKPQAIGKMVYNVFIQRHLENLMRKTLGQRWLDYKENKLIKKTEKMLQKHS